MFSFLSQCARGPRYKKKGFPWLPFGKGSANIDITGCSMNLMLTLAEDAAGHLQLASSQVRCPSC